jgi:hypothetical protein
MIKARTSALHLAVFACAGIAAPAEAQSAGYSATLAAPAAARKAVVNGVVWRCEGDTCVAPLDGARPAIACGKMVRAFGSVTRFASPKGELSADDLARCNAAAK